MAQLFVDRGTTNWARPDWPLRLNASDWRLRNCVGLYPLLPETGGCSLVGNPINRTIEGTVAYEGDSTFLSGLKLDGTTTNVNIGDVDVLDGATSYTLACWVRYGPTISTSRRLIAKWTTSLNTSAFILGQDDTTAEKLIMAVCTSTSNRSIWITTDSVVAAAGTYRIVCCWHGGNSWTVYVNGVSVGLTQSVGNSVASVPNRTVTLRFGASNATAENFNDCTIADVYLAKDRVWSAAEARSDYDLTTRWDHYAVPSRSAFFEIGSAASTWPGYYSAPAYGWF